MYDRKIIILEIVLSGLVVMIFLLLFSVTATTSTIIPFHQQEASSSFHEKLFGGSTVILSLIPQLISNPQTQLQLPAQNRQTGTPISWMRTRLTCLE
jgi:hypothetical protein